MLTNFCAENGLSADWIAWVCSVAAIASETDVFNSPEVAKSFDFTNEEKIYKW